MIPLPDLLEPRPHAPADDGLLDELLELAFLGKESPGELEDALHARAAGPSSWDAAHFAADLFLDDLVDGCFGVRAAGRAYPVHRPYLRRVLESPSTDLATIRFRQAILRELEDDPAIRDHTERLYVELAGLLTLFKAMRTDMRLNSASFRLDILRQARDVVETMVGSFSGASSGLRRLHEVGEEIRRSRDYKILAALLDHEDHLGSLNLDVRVGADGRLRALAVRALSENSANPFYASPWRRWVEAVRLMWHRYSFDSRDLVDTLILSVYKRIAPAVRTLLQVLCQLEVYLGAMSFAQVAKERGLAMCLPVVEPGAAPLLTRVFNPLLLRGGGVPVPCSIDLTRSGPIVIVTGPNSGGKTRLLQGIGLTQVLAQCGLFVPCADARVPLVRGLFVSLVERGGADEVEGRLGSELLRIRTLFRTVPSRSLVLLDELCSGTNPSEAIEIVSMVLDLLRELAPVAFITTHFLDFARRLESQRSVSGLEFLQVKMDEHQQSTYQFVPGVASTSLAAGTARRLGVTFEELAELVRDRRRREQVAGRESLHVVDASDAAGGDPPTGR